MSSISTMCTETKLKHPRSRYLPCPSSSSLNKFSAPYFKMSLISCLVSDSFFSLFDITELPPMPRWTISSDNIIFCLHTWSHTTTVCCTTLSAYAWNKHRCSQQKLMSTARDSLENEQCSACYHNALFWLMNCYASVNCKIMFCCFFINEKYKMV